jgi:hypothetical protein
MICLEAKFLLVFSSFLFFFLVAAEGASSASATAASVGDEMNVDGDDVAGDRQCLPLLNTLLYSSLLSILCSRICVPLVSIRELYHICFLCDFRSEI